MQHNLCILFVWALFLGCKPTVQSNSQVESLDLFADSSIDRKNYCQRDPEVKYDLESVPVLSRIRIVGEIAETFDVPLYRAVAEASTSVPTELQKFFVANRGMVVVIDNAAEICTNELRKNGQVDGVEEINSCILGFGANDEHDQIINIILPPSVTEIRHNLLLTFGSFVTQFVPLLRTDLASELENIQFELGRSFVTDVVDKNVFKLATLKDYLGSNVDFGAAFTAVKNLNGKGDPLTKFSFANDKSASKADRRLSRKKFLDMVTAHSFDSYYCNDWFKYDKNILADIKNKKKPYSDLKSVKNTKDVMEVLFTKTHGNFSKLDKLFKKLAKIPTEKGISQEEVLKNISQLSAGEASFSLAGGDQSPYWAGTKAFFGSIYGNTGGAASNAYKDYSNSVGRAVNSSGYDPNSSFVGNVAKGVGGGVSDQYNDKIYQPTYQKAEDRYNVQVQGGASRPATNTVLLAAGDILGTTQISEAGAGIDTQSAQYLSTGERVQRGVQGTATLAGNLATVGGFSPSLSAKPIFGTGARGAGTGVITNAADDVTRAAVTTTLNDARAAGTATQSFEKWAGRTADAFGEGARAVEIPAGTKVYRTFDGANPTARPMSQWVSREPPAITGSTPDFLGLPQNMAKPVVREFVTTKPLRAVEGSIAPIEFKNGISRAGGGQQLFVPVELNQLSGVMRTSNDALLKAAGTRSATTLVPVNNGRNP